MDLTFNCPHCNQQLEVEASAAGQPIQCPTCHAEITVPQPDPTNVHTLNPMATSAASKIEHHFVVPVREGPAEALIAKQRTLDEIDTTTQGPKKMRVRIIRHTDCVEVGHDKYEEMVGAFLNKVGEENIISLSPLTYTHIDIATQKILTDYALQII